MKFKVLLITLLISFELFIFSSKAISQVLQLNSVEDKIELNNYVSVLEDSSHKINIKEILQSDNTLKFEKLDNNSPINPGYIYWTKLALKNTIKDEGKLNSWKLFTDEADYIDVYLIDSIGNIIQHKRTGTFVPAFEKEIKTGNKIQRVNISFLPNQLQYLFIRYERINHQPINIKLHLQKEDYYSSWDYIKHARRSWLFIGFMITMFIFNLAFYTNTRDKAYLFHALFIIASLIFLSDYYGILADIVFIKDHPFLIGHIDYMAISLLSISYISFIRYYLDIDKILPSDKKIFNYLVIFQIICFFGVEILYSFTLWEPLTDKLLASSVVIVFLIIHIFFISNYKLKSTRAYFLIAGSLLIFIALLLNSFSIFQGHGVLNETTELLFSGEILIFSLGLGYRVKELHKEEKEVGRLLLLDNFKNKFYSNISHEFRTPLTVISGTAESLQQKQTTIPDNVLQKGLETIMRNSSALLKLVNQMLDISKIESNSMRINYVQSDLVLIIKQLVDSMHYYAAKTNVDIELRDHPEQLIMDIDEEKLHSVFSNLISNAIKFTPEGGQVNLQINTLSHGESEYVEIIIEDTGYGMDESQVNHIFDRFYTVDQKQNIQTAGTGIGLSLTKELVELLNGTIQVSSKIGEGSSFKVKLPISRKALPSDKSFTHQYIPETSLIPISKSRDYQDDNKPVLLIIEDNEDILNYLISILEDDYFIQWAKDGIEGKVLAEKILPDLIISDIMMPGKDGITLSYELKENELTNHIPIILLTAKAEIEDKMEGLRAGADAYLVKPFRREELMIRLEKLNQLRKDLRHKYSQLELLAEPKLELVEYGFINKINEVIEQNIDNEQFSVEDLADKLFISRMQLHRKLKAITDKSASHYIRAFRLIKAKPMLHDLSRSIAEIAFEVGFSDPNYFSKSFLKEFGTNPSDYRLKLTGK